MPPRLQNTPGFDNCAPGRRERHALRCWRNRIGLLIALALPIAPTWAAADPPLQLDSARSSAEFEVKVLWLIGVHGRFGQVQGSITVDRARETAVADARIDVGSITMRNHSYETWLKSPEFFAAHEYPEIRFQSEPFALAALRSGGPVAGTLTLRGVRRQIVLSVLPSRCPDQVARDCPVEASGNISRSEFGMSSRRGTLSDEVELGFSIYLSPPSNGTAPAL